MADMRTPPATPMTRKLVKRMVQVEENLQEILKGAACEYVIEIKIKKIPPTKAFSPINELSPIEDVQDKNVTNEEIPDEKSKLNCALHLQNGDVSSQLQEEEVGLETTKDGISPESQQEDISPESSLALAMIEKEIIPTSRKLRRSGNRRSIKVKKFGSKESENRAVPENIETSVIQEQNEIITKPPCLKHENNEDVPVSENKVTDTEEVISMHTNIEAEKIDLTAESMEEVFKPPEIFSESVKEVSESHEQIPGLLNTKADTNEVLQKLDTEVIETDQQIVETEIAALKDEIFEPPEEQEVASEPVENESEGSELVSDCDDTISDAEDVTFSEDLTPDLFRSNIRNELAELAMELIGSEPALADLALQLGTQEPSPEPHSELVATPDLPDLAEIKSEKTDLKRVDVIFELPSEKESSEITSKSNDVTAEITSERVQHELQPEVDNEEVVEMKLEKDTSELLTEVDHEVAVKALGKSVAEENSIEIAPSQVDNEIIEETPLEIDTSELLSEVDQEVIPEVLEKKESSAIQPDIKNEPIVEIISQKESPELLSEVHTLVTSDQPTENESLELVSEIEHTETEDLEEQTIFNEEKESSELLLSEVNTDERVASEQKEDILQKTADESVTEALKEELDIVTLDEAISIREDSYEETNTCFTVEEPICEKENEDNNVELQIEDEVTNISNEIPEERPVIQQRKPLTLTVTQAPPLAKKQPAVKSQELKYLGCIGAIFLLLFYILNLLEKSQAPRTYNI